MSYAIGNRVRTTVSAPAARPGTFGAPAGTLGTIDNIQDKGASYGVLLDGDPDQLPASFDEDELEPAP